MLECADMSLDETMMAVRVSEELARILDQRVADSLRTYLVPPCSCWLDWDYGHPHTEFPEPRYPGFIVAEFPDSGTGIAYSVHGFGPSRPWGLISIARPGYGEDSGWFQTLEEAFRDSMAWDEPSPMG
jgi:hypothetical protein